MYINIKNTKSDVLNVTTNHAKFYNNGDEIKPYDRDFPHLIIKLRLGEEFSCRAYAVLNIAKRPNDNDNRWSAIANCWFERINDNKYKFHIKSIGQLDEYMILYKACQIIKEKLRGIKLIIGNKFKDTVSNKNEMDIVLDHEDHTVGSIITSLLQDHKDTQFAGLAKKDLLKDEIMIKFISKEKLRPFFSAIDSSVSMFSHMEKIFSKMGRM